ncbi:hypothetical protein BO94DRAFT_539656 [Aspergillus sclerotioniger CBS 115572]|uniref:Uncharacterized protein n=1 Tax=Aspergillus sclerotioniger CBS 115572 TaxID=1450535 RepID=A0A317VA71_9EURO|nr:hypothetical protein BO94DRAFT_539656 [Aspergillus sclerotioniger CBS 115572]PWY71116.1 hypothetical protein BO94DRAFT_539656 [Aspergillus sclerotioniger CBS 115572]
MAGIRRMDRYDFHGHMQKIKALPNKWTQAQLKRIKDCARRINESGKLGTKEIKKLRRDPRGHKGEQYPKSSKTQRRHRIFAAFLKTCIQEFGLYMGLLCSCALAHRTIADVGSDKRNALIKALKTKSLRTETLTTLASKHGAAGRQGEDWQYEYNPSAKTMQEILDNMKEGGSMRLKCWIPVENAQDRPHLTFAIDRDLFWKIVDIANVDDMDAFIDQDSSATTIVP